MMTIPRVKFDIDSNDPISGVKTISLVNEPAIESDFIFFSKEKQSKKFIELKKDGYKQIVAGLALIPEKDILRYDGEGQPYYGYFTAESIEKIRTKFHKEQMTSNVNTDHSSDNYIDAFLIESFILDSEERLADVKGRGIDEATIGSWFVAYKIESEEVFKKVVSGELNGFSIEIFLNKFFKVEKNNINNFQKVMKDFIQKFKQLLAEIETKEEAKVEEKKFETAKDASGKNIEYGEVGEAVSIVAEDGTKETASDAEYVLDNGKTIIVGSGALTEIKDTEQPAPEEQKKEEEKLGSSVYATYQLADGTQANVNVSSINEVYIWNGEKSELAVSGKYEIKEGGLLVVEDGKFIGVENATDSKSFDEKKELAKVKAELSKITKQKEDLSKQISSLKIEVEKLKKAPITKPTVKVEKVEEIDLSKLSNADKLRLQYKITKN